MLKRFNINFLAVLTLLNSLSIMACKSTPTETPSANQQNVELPPQQDFINQATLDNMAGKWLAQDGSYFEYPFIADHKTYILYHQSTSDDTGIWVSYSIDYNQNINDLWQKRFSMIKDIYNLQKELPLSDDQDIQQGKRLTFEDGIITASDEYLIPEKILAVNLSSFSLSSENNKLKVTAPIHLTSTTFSDISISEDNIYEKQ